MPFKEICKEFFEKVARICDEKMEIPERPLTQNTTALLHNGICQGDVSFDILS